MTNQAYVTPRVLRWARERSHLSVEETASKIPVRPDQLLSWENDAAKPTFRQAQKLAHVLHVPFGYLFLSSPPLEKPAIPDLRTVADEQRNSFSPNFLELLNDVLRKQQWYREFHEAESSERLTFIGGHRNATNERVVAADISRTFGIDDHFRLEAANWEDFLTKLIERCESHRILILRSSIVKSDTQRALSVDEFRGFAITDDLAPLIFLNGRDAKAAQIFTLVHELAHLWIGQSGISNPYLGQRSISNNLEIERRCNRIAAEVLVPRETFSVEWQANQRIEINFARLTRRYRVSSLVILRRALDLGKIAWENYIAHFRQQEARYKARESAQEGKGGNFYAILGSRNSKQLVRAVVSAALEGRTLYRDAARLLGVKAASLERVAVKFGIRL